MPNTLEIRVEHKRNLSMLLRIKKANLGSEVKELQKEIIAQVQIMEQEDVAYVEKLAGVKALD